MRSGPQSSGAILDRFGEWAFRRGDGTLEAVRKGLIQEGEGSRAIVFADSIDGPVGHVFNALYRDGKIYFVDPQRRLVMGHADFSKFRNFKWVFTKGSGP